MKLNWKSILISLYEVGSISFLVIIAFFGAIALYSKLSHGSQFKLLSVVSGSMKPAIGVGSVVFVQAQKDYYVNDIVTYRLGANLVTHRIIFAHNYFLTKGDANTSIDPKTVSKNNIVGKVIFTVPWIGYLQESTKTATGLISFILIPSLLIVIHESWIIIREMKKVSFNFNILRDKPILGIAIGGIFLLVIPPTSTLAYYQQRKNIFSIEISTASISPSPTATISPTISPSPSPTSSPTASPSVTPSSSPSSTPSPTATPNPSSIGNSGNGSGSTNTVIINNTNSTTVNQTNTSSQSNTVTNIINTGNNSGQDINTATSSAATTINNQSNSNSVIIQ